MNRIEEIEKAKMLVKYVQEQEKAIKTIKADLKKRDSYWNMFDKQHRAEHIIDIKKRTIERLKIRYNNILKTNLYK